MKKLTKGITIIELIIYGALMGIFLLVLTEILVSVLDVGRESEAASIVQSDARFVLSRLSYDIARADSVTVPGNLGETSSNLTLITGGEAYAYTFTNGNLELTNTFGTNKINSSETRLSNLTFKRLGNSGGKHTIQIIYTIESVTVRPGGPEVRNYQTTVGLR